MEAQKSVRRPRKQKKRYEPENFSEDSDEVRALQESRNFNPQWDLLAGKKQRQSGSSKNSQLSSNPVSGVSGKSNDDTGIEERRPAKKRIKRKHTFAEVKKDWVKVTHQIVTKRMLSVPKHIEELKIVFWNRFNSLKDQVSDPSAIELLAELPRDEVGNVDTFPLQTSKDLQDYVDLSNSSQVCPRFRITVGSEDSTSVSDHPSAEAVPPLAIGGPQDERMSWALQIYAENQHLVVGTSTQREINLIADDREEGKSVIDWSMPPAEGGRSKEDDYFKEGEDPFDLELAQATFQDQRDKLRDEVQLCEDGSNRINAVPSLPIEVLDQDVEVALTSSARVRHQEQRISKKRRKNTVQFSYDLRLARLPQKREWGSFQTNIFMKKQGVTLKDLACVAHVPEQASCPKNEFHTEVQAGQTAYIQFKVFNRTNNDWDAGCFLINNFQKGQEENFFEITKSITKNVMFFLEIQIYIPAIASEQLLDIKFQFVTPRMRPFGEPMRAKIKIFQADQGGVSHRSSNMQMSSHLSRISDAEILQKAGELADFGFGNFETCLKVLSAKQGDMTQAKKSLSKAIFNEQKVKRKRDKQ